MSGSDGTADCLFCRIVKGEVPSDVVVETEGALAFRDINPAAPTHVLVIPKQHVDSAHALMPEHDALLGDLFDVVRRVAQQEGIADAYRIVSNVGSAAGQSVFHLHLHVLGGRSLSWPPG